MREANRNSKVPKYIRRIELVQRRSIMYYQQQDSQPFLKIVVALPTMVSSCRGMIYENFMLFKYNIRSLPFINCFLIQYSPTPCNG